MPGSKSHALAAHYTSQAFMHCKLHSRHSRNLAPSALPAGKGRRQEKRSREMDIRRKVRRLAAQTAFGLAPTRLRA
jgi:hypothetical protein